MIYQDECWLLCELSKTLLEYRQSRFSKDKQGYHFDQSVSILNLNNHGYLNVFSKNIDCPVRISLKL
ncbi:hypothetical protein FY049_05380 [Acinetobacter sp. 1125_18A]